MSPHFLSPSLLPLVLCAASLVGQEPIVRADRQVELRFHPGQLDVALAARLADAAWAAAQQGEAQLKSLGVLPKATLKLNVWADLDAFGAIAGARPVPQVHESADAATVTAQIGLHPPMPPERLDLIGLPMATRDAIVRQLAWLAAAQTELGAKDDMLCRVVAAGVLDQLDNPKARPGLSLGFDSRRRYARAMRASEKFDWGAYVDRRDAAGNRDQWLLQWEHAGWCAQALAGKSSSWAKKLLTASAATKKAKDATAVRRAQLAAVFSGSWDKFEARLLELVTEPSSAWTPVFDDVSWRDGRMQMAGSKPIPARVLRLQDIPKGPFAIRCEVEVAEVGPAELQVQFIDDRAEYTMFLNRGDCEVSECHDGKWGSIEKQVLDEPKRTFQLSVEVADVLRVCIDGKPVVQAPFGDFPMRDRIGVSCLDGVVWLRDLRVEPLVVGGR